MAPNGPPDDFNRQPTQQADFGPGRYRPPGAPPQESPAVTEPPPPADQFDEPQDSEAEPSPWYRKPAMLIGWAALVLILIVLIIFGIMELIGGNQGNGPTPSSTTTAPTTTVAPTTTPTPPTTNVETTPPTSGPVEPPPSSRPQPTHQPPASPQPTQQPTHHHLPRLPSVIEIPGVPPITLPPGLSE